MGRTVAVKELSEWMCRECGYDMGPTFVECDLDSFSRDGFLVCPDCESTFIPSKQTNHSMFAIRTPTDRSRNYEVIVEHRAEAYATTKITLPEGYSPEDVETWELQGIDTLLVYIDTGEEGGGLEIFSYDLECTDEAFTIGDTHSTEIQDSDYNNTYWRSDY